MRSYIFVPLRHAKSEVYMKNKLMIFTVLAIAIIAMVAGGCAMFRFDGGQRRLCHAAGIYDMLKPELIEMYEREVAGESIVSDKSAAQLQRVADRLGIGVQKLKAIMLLQDLAAKTGRSIALSELAEMGDLKVISYFKQCGKDYLSQLTPERRKQLEDMLKGSIA